MSKYADFSKEELINKIEALEADLGLSLLQGVEMEKINEHLLDHRRANFLNILMNTLPYLSKIYSMVSNTSTSIKRPSSLWE